MDRLKGIETLIKIIEANGKCCDTQDCHNCPLGHRNNGGKSCSEFVGVHNTQDIEQMDEMWVDIAKRKLLELQMEEFLESE